MKYLVDKLLLLLACGTLPGTLAGVLPCAHPELAVVAFLVAATSSALIELVKAPWRVALPLLLAAGALVAPAVMLPVLPLAAYDLARAACGRGKCSGSWWWVVAALVPLLGAFGSALENAASSDVLVDALAALAPTATLCALAWLLGTRTARALANQHELEGLRDSLQESVLRLRRKNAELDEARAHQTRAAALAERARIARDIHDNVGHLLTRGVFQVEALQVVHASDALGAELEPVGATLHEALATVRASVHNLHDESVDLETQLRALAVAYPAGTAELFYAAEQRPSPEASDCIVAVMREALANSARHGKAEHVRVEVEEHPAFWRLRVTDDGRAGAAALAGDSSAWLAGAYIDLADTLESGRAEGRGAPRTSRGAVREPSEPSAPEGLGLRSMRERIEALGGTFWARPNPQPSRTGAPVGFTVFASIPKAAAQLGAPQAAALKTNAPRSTTSKSTVSEPSTSQSATADSAAPKSASPQAAPQASTPQTTAPQSNGPQSDTPGPTPSRSNP